MKLKINYGENIIDKFLISHLKLFLIYCLLK